MFLFALGAVVWLAGASPFSAQEGSPGEMPMATRDRVEFSSWWPTKGTAARGEYVGAAACASCHPHQAATFQSTPMAHASTLATNSEILRSHPHMNFRLGPYRYEITASADQVLYSVRDSARTISAPLGWAFGDNEVGQTYVYELNGSFYESRLSYYRQLQGLDISPGHPRGVPDRLEDAPGRPIGAEETQHCFGCHDTAAVTGDRLNLEHLIDGVSCESCHGPGARHAAAMQAEDSAQGAKLIVNPGTFGPVASVDFCGACHRTMWDVAMAGITGILTVRFQPYRLETSKCWEAGADARLTCIACHDPHKPLEREVGSYDAACMRCHSASAALAQHGSRAAICPVAAKNCVTCHMPKYRISDLHSTFTDHRIRIVQKGAPFPG